MKRYISIISLITALSWLLAGCQKELVYPDKEVNPYRLTLSLEWELEWEVNPDESWIENWDNVGSANDYDFFRPRKPEGVAVILYNGTKESYTFAREIHLPASGGSFNIDPTTRAILFINDDSDYVVINNLGSPHTVTATTGNHQNTAFNDLHPDERSAKQPDILYGALVELSEEDINQGNLPDKVVISPLVYGYVIRYRIDKNLEYVVSASGALSGMAEAVNIRDGSTSDSRARYLFDCEVTDYGVEVQVMTFGVPSMEGNSSTKASTDYQGQHDLRLNIKLTNGKSVTFEHDVTDQLAAQKKGGVIAVEGLEIPDDLVKGNSGFDPDIDEWGENTDIPLPVPVDNQ